MMYASKTPRDLNRDPKPMIDPFTGHRVPCADESLGWAWHPRPEFDAVQHNEPNRVLVRFREYVAESQSQTAASYARMILRHFPVTFGMGALLDSERDHARRVLTRLANLKEES